MSQPNANHNTANKNEPQSDFKETITRLIAMGDRPLMEGFSLLGFETWPNASDDDLQQVLSELLANDQAALVLLQSYLSQSKSPLLMKLRTHGGKIIITEVPAINAAHSYQPYLQDLIIQTLGNHSMDPDETSLEVENNGS